MADIKNIIFDMGGVLIRFDRHYFISRLGYSGEDEKILLREVFLSLEWAQMDWGSIDEAGALENIRARIPERLHEAARRLLLMWERPILPIEGMEELIRDEERTVIIVSHMMEQLLELCTKVIWIDGGRVVMSGDPREVIEAYRSRTNVRKNSGEPAGEE